MVSVAMPDFFGDSEIDQIVGNAIVRFGSPNSAFDEQLPPTISIAPVSRFRSIYR